MTAVMRKVLSPISDAIIMPLNRARGRVSELLLALSVAVEQEADAAVAVLEALTTLRASP